MPTHISAQELNRLPEIEHKKTQNGMLLPAVTGDWQIRKVNRDTFKLEELTGNIHFNDELQTNIFKENIYFTSQVSYLM